jgi:hypothetical protein
MDIEQSSSFSKLSLGDKRKHLYAIYVIQELASRGSITVSDEFNIYTLDVNYIDTFDSKEFETKVYGKKQTKKTKKNTETSSETDESVAKSDVSETPSKTKSPRKPRAKKTEVLTEDATVVVPETPSKPKSPRKPRAKKTEVVTEDATVVVPETPSKPKTPRKPRAKKSDVVTPIEIVPTPIPTKEIEEPVIVPEIVVTPTKKRGPSKKKTTTDDVEEPKTIADKIVDCVPKKEKKPRKSSKKEVEESVSVEEEQVPRSLTPELTEELLPNISVVETENEDGVAITYLLDNNTSLLYHSDDHALKKSIGRMQSSDEIELFE